MDLLDVCTGYSVPGTGTGYRVHPVQVPGYPGTIVKGTSRYAYLPGVPVLHMCNFIPVI